MGRGSLMTQSKIATTLLIASVLGLMACKQIDSNTISGSVSFATTGETKQVADVNLVKDSFESQGLVGNGGDIDCDHMGKLDPSVKVGDRVLSKHLRADQNGQRENLSANTIEFLSETKTESLVEYLSMNVSSPALGETLAKPLRQKFVCDDEQGGCLNIPIDSITESLTAAALNYYDTHDSESAIDCYLKEEIEDSSVREHGIYTLASGKKIKAVRTIRIAHGRAACDMNNGSRGVITTEVGAGEIRSVVIRSNEVSPGLLKYSCGGAPVLYGSTVKADSKVIQSDRTEQITPVLKN